MTLAEGGKSLFSLITLTSEILKKIKKKVIPLDLVVNRTLTHYLDASEGGQDTRTSDAMTYSIPTIFLQPTCLQLHSHKHHLNNH